MFRKLNDIGQKMQEDNDRIRDQVLNDDKRRKAYQRAEKRADDWLRESAEPIASSNEVLLYEVLLLCGAIVCLILVALGI